MTIKKNQQNKKIKTRFAPSPTGFIHLGNIRSAIYPWAFAKANNGEFILRIEDTDLERSTQEAVDIILESMDWLGLKPDLGPFFQMQRMNRYLEVLEELKQKDLIYPCYMSTQELDNLRNFQMANKIKPRYDGTWRPEEGKILPKIPENVKPVWRFKTPKTGIVSWIDKCKGKIEIQNSELDDLIIARPDGTPTYNFCVCVDDIDMEITHVIRGDDHINNTPRQIHIFQALEAQLPTFAHLPTVLNEAGEKLSKRQGAKAVTWYRDAGFLPDAMLNYLARLGWSHGNDEFFTREQFLEWFNLEHLGKSASQFDETKLKWLNFQHLKSLSNEKLAELVKVFLKQEFKSEEKEKIIKICETFKERSETLVDLASWIDLFLINDKELKYNEIDFEKFINSQSLDLIRKFAENLENLENKNWNKVVISVVIKDFLTKNSLKMPSLAMPVRVLTLGKAQTPSLDLILELLGKEKTLSRLKKLKN